MLREALRELGHAPDGELIDFIARRFGVRVEPRFLPIWRASLRGAEVQKRLRGVPAAPPRRIERPASR
jgi:hypothetical protein